MNGADEQAFPISGSLQVHTLYGLTKRELIAINVLTTLLAKGVGGFSRLDFANASVSYADALLESLAK